MAGDPDRLQPMRDVDREAIRVRKDICGGCGAPLLSQGEIPGDQHRGEQFVCTRETCGYVEWRLYGDGYYEVLAEEDES